MGGFVLNKVILINKTFQAKKFFSFLALGPAFIAVELNLVMHLILLASG
jgi:hypothetical protein